MPMTDPSTKDTLLDPILTWDTKMFILVSIAIVNVRGEKPHIIVHIP